MVASVEYYHNKISQKIKILKDNIDKLVDNEALFDVFPYDLKEVKSNIISIERNYLMSISSSIIEYYLSDNSNESFRKYNEIINTENTVYNLYVIVKKLMAYTDTCIKHIYLLHHELRNKTMETLHSINNDLLIVLQCDIINTIEQVEFTLCDCNSQYNYNQDLCEMTCSSCGHIQRIIGNVKKLEYNNYTSNKSNSTYEPSRHYRFWIERLQALENKKFDDDILTKINYVIQRDGYKSADLNCEIMRNILKDPKVNATKLNDHIPLLVVTFGGRAPPRLTFHENYVISIKFAKIIELYNTHIMRGGNKPYYPYFIYKIIEHEFRNNPEKKRLLNYIHLQSKSTVSKNDEYFYIICQHTKKEDDLVYNATDIARSFVN